MELDYMDIFIKSFEFFWTIIISAPLLSAFIFGSFLFAIIINIVSVIIRERRISKSGILDIDKMKGVEFEDYLFVLFKKRGFNVRKTAGSHDYGADLVLKRNGKRIVVQAKRYKNKVGIRAVQEIVGARDHYNADESWVVTNSYFTEPAKRLAKSNRVLLYDRDNLMAWMISINKK